MCFSLVNSPWNKSNVFLKIAKFACCLAQEQWTRSTWLTFQWLKRHSAREKHFYVQSARKYVSMRDMVFLFASFYKVYSVKGTKGICLEVWWGHFYFPDRQNAHLWICCWICYARIHKQCAHTLNVYFIQYAFAFITFIKEVTYRSLFLNTYVTFYLIAINLRLKSIIENSDVMDFHNKCNKKIN